ncbi:MAG TPA: ABC transporter permease, partial [Candidatus Limnocylindrales bacterium]|nr:ABC transporter permease [Candidatus Limnocylindrales bacterium]
MTSPAIAAAPPRPGPRRRLLGFAHRHRSIQLLFLLTPPVGWFGVVYLGSLAVLFVAAFWYLDPLTSAVRHDLTLGNFQQVLTNPVYRTIAVRTVVIAALVTATDILLAFPLAYFMARRASRRTQGLLVMLVLLPLWSSYLVRVYAWRVILSPGGPLDWLLGSVGVHGFSLYLTDAAMWVVFSYIWLPYMVLPIFAGLERIPSSLLDASADLGGRGATTFRRVVLPLALPAVVAGSIFTFSLTLGDYITPALVSNSQFIGNVVYDNQGVAGNLPFAAAFATVPVIVMAIYLLVARRLG